MTDSRDITLLNELLLQHDETFWLEFKQNNTDPVMIGKRCSALSNAARSRDTDYSYLVWGIEDETKKVVGTTFHPETQKVGGMVLPMWLAQRLKPSIAFEFKTITYENKRVVLLEIPAASGSPVLFEETPYIRIGSATPKLTDYSERYQLLLNKLRTYQWESEPAISRVSDDDVLDLLDYASYFRYTGQRLPEGRTAILDHLDADRLIKKGNKNSWDITNLGAILFAYQLSKFGSAIERKGVRFVAYKGKNRAATVSHRLDGQKGYAVGFEGLVSFINGLLPTNEHIGEALRVSQPLFPELAIRELVANALIHQDMSIRGAGPLIELFEDRLEISNPGVPLMQADRMVDLPPRSRNEALAALMRRMKFCEEQGSGLDKVLTQAEIFQLPAPLFLAAEDSTRVILYGPRSFAEMTDEERIRSCYFHAVLKVLSGEKMKNNTLCARLGIQSQNAAQASKVINKAVAAGLIKPADPERPRAGYIPFWA